MSLDPIWEGKAVLVVDDSDTSRTLLLHMLESLPVRLHQAVCGRQFQEMVNSQFYDLILLDFRLPDGNGVELLRVFRESCQLSTVVLVTGQADLATATAALAKGADGYLEKGYLNQGAPAFRLALEQAMHRRAGLLTQMELANLKEEFYAVIFHDLRSPAAGAQMALNLYRESGRPELLGNAAQCLDQLFQRLDRYLDYMRMESLTWKMSLQTCDLFAQLHEVVQRLQPLAQEKCQTLDWNPPEGRCLLEADPIWLPEVFENLLANAIKYTPANGVIGVTVRSETARVTCEFRDNGPGIPPALHQRIFQRYFRVNPEAPQKGSGLGLLIAKNVVEAHGGKIGVDSSGVEGKGTVFRVQLPVS